MVNESAGGRKEKIITGHISRWIAAGGGDEVTGRERLSFGSVAQGGIRGTRQGLWRLSGGNLGNWPKESLNNVVIHHVR